VRCRQRKIIFPREFDTRSSDRFDIVIDNPIIHANLKSQRILKIFGIINEYMRGYR